MRFPLVAKRLPFGGPESVIRQDGEPHSLRIKRRSLDDLESQLFDVRAPVLRPLRLRNEFPEAVDDSTVYRTDE